MCFPVLLDQLVLILPELTYPHLEAIQRMLKTVVPAIILTHFISMRSL